LSEKIDESQPFGANADKKVFEMVAVRAGLWQGNTPPGPLFVSTSNVKGF
jgi:hypothetical protein